MEPYKEFFLTRHYELATDHLVRVQTLCNYMEEAAGNHAAVLGAGLGKLAEDELAWVLAKMRVVFFRRPGPLEKIRVETWPVAMERVQFRRDFILYDAQDAVMATAVTQWVVMGLKSRRLERFPQYIAAMQPQHPPVAQQSGDIKIPVLGPVADGLSFPVRMADIDQNNHVNNGRYIDFVLEAAERARSHTGNTGSLRQLDVVFRSEGVLGDVIVAKAGAEEQEALSNVTGLSPVTSMVHSLVREKDGRELARARTVFA